MAKLDVLVGRRFGRLLVTAQASNVSLTVGELTQCSAAWSEALGGNRGLVDQRLRCGWPIEAACTTPLRKGKALHLDPLGMS
jgi:hypothetical protein